MIDAKSVKELRDITGAGMMDCKKALVETNGDMDKAIDYLREKGISKAAKKADRIAAEGLANIYIEGNNAVIIEINSETDFVAKNEDFKSLVDKIGNTVLKSNATSVEEALELSFEDAKLNDLIISETLTIGEKLSFRRFEKITKSDSETFGAYLHMGGKIASLVLTTGDNENIAKDIAMQVAAMKPEYLSSEDIPSEVLEKESNIIREQVIEEGKKPEFADKIIEGRLQKFYTDVCLLNQAFVKDGDFTVERYLSENNSKVKLMIRYEVGEGMEKRNDDFASEVMSQLKD